MERWGPGYSQSQIDDAQERYGVRFPPDLIELFLNRRPLEGYDWDREDPRIREMLEWPLEYLLFDVDNGSWLLDWGDKPESAEECREIVRGLVACAPRLIPILSHRFIPEVPSVTGNPVFSMHGFDTIYYGANLDEYFDNEFGGKLLLNGKKPEDYDLQDTLMLRRIPFWSDLALNHGRWIVEEPEA